MKAEMEDKMKAEMKAETKFQEGLEIKKELDTEEVKRQEVKN